MSVIVDLMLAAKFLKIEDSLVGSPPADEVLQGCIDAAEGLVLDYVKQRRIDDDDEWKETVEGWTSDGSPGQAAPPEVVAAILRQTAELWRFRGDDVNRPDVPEGHIDPGVVRLLYRKRDPAVS